jgi:hypothetical protein
MVQTTFEIIRAEFLFKLMKNMHFRKKTRGCGRKSECSPAAQNFLAPARICDVDNGSLLSVDAAK